VQTYADAFARHGITVGQVLLTADDLTRRGHYRNARQTIERLLSLGVLPIVNENDTVATEEIRFGDNDRLAALVAHVAVADALLLLSDVDGVYDGDPRTGPASLIDTVRNAADLATVALGTASRNGVGTGGMATKVEAERGQAGSDRAGRHQHHLAAVRPQSGEHLDQRDQPVDVQAAGERGQGRRADLDHDPAGAGDLRPRRHESSSSMAASCSSVQLSSDTS